MFRFEHPEFLYWLIALPVLLGLFLLAAYRRRIALRRFGNTSLLPRLMPEWSNYKHGLKFSLLLLAFAFLIIGWANPQWGSKREKVKRQSVDVFIALDISNSMLAEDIAPSRLDRAQRFAQGLVEGLKGDRLGLIIFAGNAYLQVPLTTDYAAVQLFLRSTNPDQAPTQGTAIADAIDLAERSFEASVKNHRALIVITDGENHENEAVERARKAREDGLLIYTVGVGTTEGGFIPQFQGGRLDYKRDESGAPVRTRLNEELARSVAEAGGGVYHKLSRGEEGIIANLREEIDKIEKREMEQRIFSEYNSYFQYFIGLGLLIMMFEFIISYRKSRVLPERNWLG